METSNVRSFFWETFPPLPTCRVYCSPAHQDGHLFVVGGCSQQAVPLDSVEMLDIVSQKWLALPPMPTPRAGAAAVMLGKQLMVIGGVDSTQSPLASVEVYNLDEGKWEKKADLAQASMGISAVEKDGTVYALGGMGSDTSPQALVRLYELTKDHWLPLPSMPTPCYGASTFLYGNKIFVMGGRQGKLPVTALEAFDLEVRSWTRYPNVPSRRAFASCAMADGCFFSLGGLQQPGPHNFYSRPHFVNTVEMFDLEEGMRQPMSVSEKGALRLGSPGVSYALLRSRKDGRDIQPSVYPALAHKAHTYPYVKECNEPDKICLSMPGSVTRPKCTRSLLPSFSCPPCSSPWQANFCFLLPPHLGSWSRLSRATRMRDKRADFVAGCLGRRVVVAGGLGNQSSPLDSVEGFNLAKKKWEPLPSMPTGRCSCSTLQAANLLFVIGGVAQGPSSTVEALCLRDGV